MKDNFSHRRGVLVLTSTFPRWENDSEPAFVLELRRRLCSQSYMKVLSSETPCCEKQESMEADYLLSWDVFKGNDRWYIFL